jgi:hypothetical protein
MPVNKSRSWLLITALLTLATSVSAGDAEDLTRMLEDFLAGADTAAAHERFWAEDLVYTSSSGTRTNKAAIMAGFDEGPAGTSGDPGPVYTAEEVEVNVIGTTAIIAFRLVASNPDATVQSYLNTGTILKRNGRWQVVAWQATRVP